MHATDAVPEISPALLAWFRRSADGSLGRHFHALRLSSSGGPPGPTELPSDRPLVVYFNHPSWWDPLIALRLAYQAFPERRHFGPIEAGALGRYKLSERLGFFGIETGTIRGARRFLAVSRQVLARPRTALWMTPEGRLTDPRERPTRLRSGLGHLANQVKDALLLPLALEYPFWEERSPEALARFGEPVSVGDAGMSPADWCEVLAHRLETAQDALAEEALSRDPARFDTLLDGGVGTGGPSDLWRRLRAKVRGERSEA